MTIKPTSTARIILVTGGARRLGRCIALALARSGWDVAVQYRDSKAEALEVVRAIEALGRRAVALQADLEHEDQVAALPEACARQLGELRGVVNNASLFEHDDVTNIDYATLERHTRVNLGAPLVLARELFRRLPDDATGVDAGVVINILDQKLYNYNPDFLSYSLAKAGLQAATTMLAQALAPKVRVVGVAPGLTMISAYQSEENFSAGQRRLPLAHATTPDDIAAAVCYLAAAPAVTGTTLLVDGGEHLVAAPRDVMFLPAHD